MVVYIEIRFVGSTAYCISSIRDRVAPEKSVTLTDFPYFFQGLPEGGNEEWEKGI